MCTVHMCSLRGYNHSHLSVLLLPVRGLIFKWMAPYCVCNVNIFPSYKVTKKMRPFTTDSLKFRYDKVDLHRMSYSLREKIQKANVWNAYWLTMSEEENEAAELRIQTNERLLNKELMLFIKYRLNPYHFIKSQVMKEYRLTYTYYI